ncbi:MAG: hypothetical protein KUG65_05920 [Sphingomonadaceae bacterium]|nr:hypothetical protein [Sphingomonadaceae bacterium]
MNWKTVVPIALVALIFGGGVTIYWPVQREMNAYDMAEQNFDERAKCLHAERAAIGWAGLGMTDRHQEWKERASSDCAMARLNEYVRGR